MTSAAPTVQFYFYLVADYEPEVAMPAVSQARDSIRERGRPFSKFRIVHDGSEAHPHIAVYLQCQKDAAYADAFSRVCERLSAVGQLEFAAGFTDEEFFDRHRLSFHSQRFKGTAEVVVGMSACRPFRSLYWLNYFPAVIARRLDVEGFSAHPSWQCKQGPSGDLFLQTAETAHSWPTAKSEIDAYCEANLEFFSLQRALRGMTSHTENDFDALAVRWK